MDPDKATTCKEWLEAKGRTDCDCADCPFKKFWDAYRMGTRGEKEG